MFNFNQNQNPVLDAIEKIFDCTKNSALQEDYLGKCKNEIFVIKDFFICSEEQAILLSILIQSQFEIGKSSIKDLIDHADLRTSSTMYINEILQPLVSKEWIIPKKDIKKFPLTEYGIHSKIMNSVLVGKIQKLETIVKLKTSFQVLNNFQIKLNQRRDRHITLKRLNELVHELIYSNSHLSFSKYIIDLNISEVDTTIFLYFCMKYFQGNDSFILDFLLSDLNPSNEEKYFLRKSFVKCDAYLFKLGLIKEDREDNFINNSIYRLTESAIQSFDPSATIKSKVKDNIFKHIEPQSTIAHKLIFVDEEQKMVNKLHNMLACENFNLLKNKLITQGMKPGISILLFGCPGTGKTETVMQLGKTSNRFILSADASKIRSKWVGETEKNIKALFDQYRKAVKEFSETPILLFNEADAILGKRHTVNDRGDQMENAMQNILLEELENFEGIFIATTNLVENLDSAFDRRFLYKVKFDKPGIQVLAQIWKNKFPDVKSAVLKNICQQYSLSGGQIENIRKKVTVDVLLNEKMKINGSYLLKQAEQELLLEKKSFNRNPIGFIQ